METNSGIKTWSEDDRPREKLLKKGHEVCILDNFMFGSEQIIHLLKYKNLSVNKCDIRGIKEEDIEAFLIEFKQNEFKHIQLRGVMGMASFVDDNEQVKSEFKKIKVQSAIYIKFSIK